MGVERYQGTAYNSPFLNGGRRLLDSRAVSLGGASAEVGSQLRPVDINALARLNV